MSTTSPRADLGEHVDVGVLVAVDPLVADARPGRAVGDLEVVDLLELALAVARLVVLVRRVRRPVAARREHLAGDQLVGLEAVRRAEVVDLAARLPGAAQLDRHVVGRAVAERQPSLAHARTAARTGRRRAAITVAVASRGT